jgi:hypothetical protein
MTVTPGPAVSTSLKADMPTILAVLSGLSGIAGVVCGALDAGSLTQPVQFAITAIGGLLVAITGYHATSVTAATAKVRRGAAPKA